MGIDFDALTGWTLEDQPLTTGDQVLIRLADDSELPVQVELVRTRQQAAPALVLTVGVAGGLRLKLSPREGYGWDEVEARWPPAF